MTIRMLLLVGLIWLPLAGAEEHTNPPPELHSLVTQLEAIARLSGRCTEETTPSEVCLGFYEYVKHQFNDDTEQFSDNMAIYAAEDIDTTLRGVQAIVTIGEAIVGLSGDGAQVR